MASSSSRSTASNGPRTTGCYCGWCTACYCGLRCVLRMSRTADNRGRQFYGCINWNAGGCNFFTWADEINTNCAFANVRSENLALKQEVQVLANLCKEMRDELRALKDRVKKSNELQVGTKSKNKKLWRVVIVMPILFGIILAICWNPAESLKILKLQMLA